MSRNIEDLYELSPMQHGMLFHTLYAPASGVYVVQLSCKLRGPIDLSSFQQSWKETVQRYVVLRTAFLWKGCSKPLQVVFAHVDIPWTHLDWRGLSQAEQEQRLAIFLQEDRKKGFDLTVAPLMRWALFQVADDAYHFVWSFHHILLDGWSYALVVKDVSTFYEAFVQSKSIHLPPPRPYREYILWLQQQDQHEAEAYWRSTLNGFTQPTRLGRDRGTSEQPNQQTAYAVQQIQAAEAITAELQRFAQRYHLTLNTLVQGAWTLLLSSYSGRSDLVFGMTVSGRPPQLAGVETMGGLFINTLPVRICVQPEVFLLDWLKILLNYHTEARQYEYCPLVRIHEWSQLPQNVPLFEYLFVFENYPIDASIAQQRTGNGLQIYDSYSTEVLNYPLNALAIPSERLTLRLGYDTSRFHDTTIKELLMHWLMLLEHMVAVPEQRISNLPFLTNEERQLLVTWNATNVAYPQNGYIHEVFEQQAGKTPDAIAIIFEECHVSYQYVNKQANQVAHRLHQSHITADRLVGICMERSIEMVVALLGILKAGGAYVPLDPTYPVGHLKGMIQNAQISVLLTQPSLLPHLPSVPIDIICLGRKEGILASKEPAYQQRTAMGEQLFSVIYTSGSTGQPKGVMNTHAGLFNRLNWMQQTYHLTPADRILQKTPFNFDVSAWEFFWPLMVGASLVVARPGGHRDPTYLSTLIETEHITTLHFVPSMLAAFLHRLPPGRCQNLKRVFCSGEVLSFDLQERFFSCLEAELHNLYGPTEAAIDVTCWPCQKDYPDRQVPIGYPIANTQIHLLNEWMHPVPIGVQGEVYIGGANVARGYHQQPALTAERFVPDPFNSKVGARLYKTGDLARRHFNGSLEFIGRLDQQVKLRGFRIEPGEIEAVLRQHPSIENAVVTLTQRTSSDPYLVAHLLPSTSMQQPLSVAQVRHFLREQLPEYAVPSYFTILDAFPLLPTGKIDYKALARRDPQALGTEEFYTPPQTTVEKTITTHWQKVLRREKVGIHNNFFDLGGNSLLMIHVHQLIEASFQREIPLVTLFEYPTIHDLAMYLSKVPMQQESLGESSGRGTLRREAMRRRNQSRGA